MTTAARIAAAAQLAHQLAAMPSRDSWECQEQDLAVADALEMLQTAVEGNGDAWQCLQRCIEDIRATVAMDRAHEVEAA